MFYVQLDCTPYQSDTYVSRVSRIYIYVQAPILPFLAIWASPVRPPVSPCLSPEFLSQSCLAEQMQAKKTKHTQIAHSNTSTPSTATTSTTTLPTPATGEVCIHSKSTHVRTYICLPQCINFSQQCLPQKLCNYTQECRNEASTSHYLLCCLHDA